MNLLLLYTIVLSAPIILILIGRLLAFTVFITQKKLPYLFRRYLSYRYIPLGFRNSEPLSIASALLILLYVSANAVATFVGVTSGSDIRARSGMMALINMIPLGLGGRANLVTNKLGFSAATYSQAHCWVGRMAAIQSLIHLGTALQISHRMSTRLVTGIIVSHR